MALSRRSPWLLLLLLLSSSRLPPNYFAIANAIDIAADGGGADGSVKLLATPLAVSPLDSATFEFEADLCSECTLSCKLDNYSSSECQSREVSYAGLHDGDHMFEVCISGSSGIRCDTYNWIVDTVPPTAYISAISPFTSLSNVSVDIVFSEPCTGGGGFRCSSDYCSLLVYGAGHVLPVTLKVLQPDLEFSLTVAVSSDIQYGRLVLAMDKNFCTDAAGNRFTRSSNSTFFLHVDRRNVFVNLRTHIRQKLLQLNGETRTVEATNNHKNLRIYLYFSEPVVNSSAQILNALQTSSGSLSPTNGDTSGNRRFGYTVSNLASVAVITVTCRTSFITTRQGTPVSPSDPYTFLYDAERPSVMVSTTADMRTREHKIPVLVKFLKPVFDFNSSSVFISGGHLTRFREISKSVYNMEVHADDSIVSVEVPENTAGDVAGNRNLASNRLQVRHYSVPTISSLISTITTVVFAATSLAAVLLTISTASLLSSGVFSKPAMYLISEPSRNLLRIAYHIQVFALSKWLAVSLPIEYYEFSRGIEWSIPYLSLPWETEGWESFTKDSRPPVVTYSQVSKNSKMMSFKPLLPKSISNNSSTYGSPLTPMEYMSFLEGQNMLPEAEFITHSQNRDRWKYFGRNMFWLATIGGGLMVLHIALLFILKLRRRKVEEEKEYGALLFPKFEIFLLFLALPCICQASAAIIIGKNGAGIAVGIVLLGLVLSLLLSLLLFLSVGITLGKLLQYKEVHQEGEEPHWYQELVRIILGPGKRGQWTWNNQPSSPNLTRFGPLFEDLRGPPKYMLSQFVGSGGGGPVTRDQIIASDDETEDAEAPFIQKLFGIMRIYYTFLETVKRVSLGILAGVYSSNEGPSRLPTLVVLSVTAFQLFFVMLKKPFIKKRVQLVEIISVASELLVFVSCLVLLERDFSESGARRVGFLMLAAFVVGLSAQLINEWYSLYRQVVRMSPGEAKFFPGLKTAATGILLLLLPSGLVKELDRGDYVDQGTSSETRDKPWIRQLRELAKESFSKEEDTTTQQQQAKDPSTSRSAFWGAGSEASTSKSGRFWGGKRSGSSSTTSSTDLKVKGDMKAKSRGLYKDLEAIFSSK